MGLRNYLCIRDIYFIYYMYNLCICMLVKLRYLLMCYCYDEVFNMYMFWGLYFLFIYMYCFLLYYII